MTVKEAKEKLQEVYEINHTIEIDIAKLKAMESSLFGRATNYESDGSQHVEHGNSIERAIHNVADYRAKIDAEVDKLVNKRMEIENLIDAVTDCTQRRILTMRYLLLMPWNDRYSRVTGQLISKGIINEINYSPRQVFNIHGKALENIALNCSKIM